MNPRKAVSRVVNVAYQRTVDDLTLDVECELRVIVASRVDEVTGRAIQRDAVRVAVQSQNYFAVVASDIQVQY